MGEAKRLPTPRRSRPASGRLLQSGSSPIPGPSRQRPSNRRKQDQAGAEVGPRVGRQISRPGGGEEARVQLARRNERRLASKAGRGRGRGRGRERGGSGSRGRRKGRG